MPGYLNLDGTGPQPLSAVLRWALFDKLARRRRSSPPRAPVPRVTPDLAPPARGAKVTWIGHASFLVQLDGAAVLIDPIFWNIPPFFPRNVEAGVLPGALPRLDATLITHSHYDHYDVRSVRAAGVPTIGGAGTRFDTRLHWWESKQLTDRVRVHFVPAQHWSRRTAFDTNRALWGGFVIEGETGCVYHAGDTAYFNGFAQIGKRFPIDLALLPIGAYDPGWFMERQHMNPEQAVQAYCDLGARQFVAMHWGTFKLTDEPLDEPPQRLRAEWARRGLAPEALQILPVGGSVTASAPG